MNRYNIKVVIPILNKRYEMFVPSNILVGNFIYMLLESINDIHNIKLNNMLLYNSMTGNVLNLDEYIFNSINNGMTLILA